MILVPVLNVRKKKVFMTTKIDLIISICNDNGCNLKVLNNGTTKYKEAYQQDLVCYYDKPERLMVYVNLDADLILFSCGFGGSVEINLIPGESIESISRIISAIVERRVRWKKEFGDT